LAAIELLQEAPDAELEAELERDAASLETDFRRERTALLFSGEYDERPALLSISAGAGGTEATDWTEMLLRMYLRWAERHRFPTEILDQQEGEQAGLKSVTVEVDGRRAYGWLRAERGVHRLVRISPYDSQKRRQTTFALVEVLPEADDDVEIELDWDEIRVDTFRSQGAGGQHVNKTDSAVRLTHLPTGIVAQSQNERSQTQNKETAIKVLKSRLLERALEEKEAEVRKLRGEHVEAGWGNQIRSYVLHPYQMVKDLRTNVETGNTSAVLDGDLDAFMQAELERLATGGESARPESGGDGSRAGEDTDDGEGAQGVAAPPLRPSVAGIAYRTATPDDLVACAGIWRDSINDYTRRLNQPDIPDDLAAILRLYVHLHATDPGGFVVAEQAVDGGPPAVVAFTASYRREDLWFLSMLFVLPEVQALGLGRALLAKVMPPPGQAALATSTDSVQPISNGLYASLGIAPRMPLVRLVGLVQRDGHMPELPRGVSAVPFRDLDPAAAAPPTQQRAG